MMDSSVKLLIGVVGLAGLIAFVVPSGAPVPTPLPPPPAQAVASPVILGVDHSFQAVKPASAPAQVEYFKFGEPTIDGKPFGSVDDQSDSNKRRVDTEPPAAAAPLTQPDVQNALPASPIGDPVLPSG